MTTKERAFLKSLAQTTDPVLSLGKASLTLKNCMDDPGSLAITLGERTRSEVVQVIGRKIVLYKRNHDNIKIVFPGEKIKTAKK